MFRVPANWGARANCSNRKVAVFPRAFRFRNAAFARYDDCRLLLISLTVALPRILLAILPEWYFSANVEKCLSRVIVSILIVDQEQLLYAGSQITSKASKELRRGRSGYLRGDTPVSSRPLDQGSLRERLPVRLRVRREPRRTAPLTSAVEPHALTIVVLRVVFHSGYRIGSLCGNVNLSSISSMTMMTKRLTPSEIADRW